MIQNSCKIITLLLLVLATTACDSKTFPELERKKIVERFDSPEATKHFEEQYANPKTADVFTFYKGVYEPATTINTNIKDRGSIDEKTLPWNMGISEKHTEKLLEQISQNIYAERDHFDNTKSLTLYAPATKALSPAKEEKLGFKKKNGSKPTRHKANISSDTKYKLLSYDLKNEDGEKVTFNETYPLGLRPYDGGLAVTDFHLMKPEYKSIKGHINMAFQLPVKYEAKQITPKDIGKTFTIGENVIKILEFAGNALHYQVIERGEAFELQDTGSSKTTILPYGFYKKLRENQGLTYKEVMAKKAFFEIGKTRKNYQEEVYVTNYLTKIPDSVWFYTAKYIGKQVKILVDIPKIDKVAQ